MNEIQKKALLRHTLRESFLNTREIGFDLAFTYGMGGEDAINSPETVDKLVKFVISDLTKMGLLETEKRSFEKLFNKNPFRDAVTSDCWRYGVDAGHFSLVIDLLLICDILTKEQHDALSEFGAHHNWDNGVTENYQPGQDLNEESLEEPKPTKTKKSEKAITPESSPETGLNLALNLVPIVNETKAHR